MLYLCNFCKNNHLKCNKASETIENCIDFECLFNRCYSCNLITCNQNFKHDDFIKCLKAIEPDNE